MPCPLLLAAGGGGGRVHACGRVNASSILTSTAPQQPESTRSAPAGERHQRPAAAVVRPRLRPRAADVGVRPVPPRSRGAQQRPLPGLRPVLGPALVRKLRREAVSRVGSWLNYATIHVRPRARPGAPLDCAAWAAALPAWREVEAQMCEAARRYGRAPREIAPAVRRLYRRHCAGVASGEFAREQGLLQATPTVAKHRLFVWCDARICPDHQLIVVARDDDTTFGILHSRFHERWSLRLGTSLEDRPRYTPTTTFETFPFPAGLAPNVPATNYTANPRAAAIADAARRLVELRDRCLTRQSGSSGWTSRSRAIRNVPFPATRTPRRP